MTKQVISIHSDSLSACFNGFLYLLLDNSLAVGSSVTTLIAVLGLLPPHPTEVKKVTFPVEGMCIRRFLY